EAMNFVDEQHVALFEIGEQRRKIPRLGDDGAGGGTKIDAEFLGHDLRQRRLAKAGRTDKQHMIKCFPAHLRRLDEDLEIGARRRLPDKIVQRLRAQCGVGVFSTLVGIYERITVAHGVFLAWTRLSGKRLTATIPSIPAE